MKEIDVDTNSKGEEGERNVGALGNVNGEGRRDLARKGGAVFVKELKLLLQILVVAKTDLFSRGENLGVRGVV